MPCSQNRDLKCNRICKLPVSLSCLGTFYDPYSSFLNLHYLVIIATLKHSLPRHSDTIAIDKKVCFYRQLFADPIKPHRTKTDPVGPLGCINRVACGPKLFHSTSALLVVWSGPLWPSVWPMHYVHNLVSCVYWHC